MGPVQEADGDMSESPRSSYAVDAFGHRARDSRLRLLAIGSKILSKVQVVRFRHQQQVRQIVGTDDVTWVERLACLLLEVKIHTLAWLPSG